MLVYFAVSDAAEFVVVLLLTLSFYSAESRRTLTQSTVNHAKVGFIGLGNMGANMADHLQKAGHELVVYDSNSDAMKSFVRFGATAASSPADLASKVDRVMTMVPTPKHVLEVYLGPNGVVSGGKAKAGTILIDSSTIDPQTSQQVAEEAVKAGLDFVDAPVSGAVPAARAATLTFMVGGKKESVDAIRELLLAMGKNVIHTGAVGTGVTAKLCNNMMLAISMIGTSETLNLGARLGLDPQMLTQILNISSGRTWVSEGYNPVPGVGDEKLPANHQYKGGFGTSLIAKDLNLAQSIAVQSQSPTPMGALASQLYRMMLNNGLGDKDFSYTYQFFKNQGDK